jgi:hypothetical protein
VAGDATGPSPTTTRRSGGYAIVREAPYFEGEVQSEAQSKTPPPRQTPVARLPLTTTRLAIPATPSVACFCLPGTRGIAIVVARL